MGENEVSANLMPYAFSTHIDFICDFFCLFLAVIDVPK
jgi:hypothetical protein